MRHLGDHVAQAEVPLVPRVGVPEAIGEGLRSERPPAYGAARVGIFDVLHEASGVRFGRAKAYLQWVCGACLQAK